MSQLTKSKSDNHFDIDDIVYVLDFEEVLEERALFVITGIKSNQYILDTLDKSTGGLLLVSKNEISLALPKRKIVKA